MRQYQLGTSEFLFPCWGSLAIEMAAAAGFDGIQLADAGGYLQPHPGNNGYVEYERYGLDLRRKDSFPLLFPAVQEHYLEAAETQGIALTAVYLYTLEHQDFIKYSAATPQGAQCLESIRSGIAAAAAMKIPTVVISARGMFGTAQHQYALTALRRAVELGRDCGVQITVVPDPRPEAWRWLLDALDGAVRLAIDPCGPLISGAGTPAGLIRTLGADAVEQFRVRDLPADRENFLNTESAVLLGQGDAGFSDTAQAIRESGFSGWIISDTPYYHPDLRAPGEDYLSPARKDIETLREAFPGGGERRDAQ